MASSRQRGEMDSAEWAVVIGGFSLFAIGLLAALIIVVVNHRSSARVIAAAPIQQPTASTAVPPTQPTTASQSAYAPPPPVAAAPSVQVDPQDEVNDDLSDEESDEEEQLPTTITLQAPWPDDPDDRPGDTGVVSGESMGARLAREAQERARATREARDAERRARDEERRRQDEAIAANSVSAPAAADNAPRPTPFSPAPPMNGTTDQSGLGEQRVVQSPAIESSSTATTKPVKALSAMLAFAGLFSMFGAMSDWDMFMNSRKARLFVWLLGRQGARVFYFLFGMFFLGLGALTFFGVISPDWINLMPRRHRY